MSRKKFVMHNMLWVPQPPKDINGLTLGGNYQFACMKNYCHATIFWMLGNLAADITLTIKQAKNIGGGSNKALTVPDLYRLATTAGDAKDQTKWISDSRGNAASVAVTNTAPAEDNYVFAAELEAEQLDVQNGFDCIRPEAVAGSGATLAAIFVIFSNAKFQGDLAIPALFPSVLAGEQEVI